MIIQTVRDNFSNKEQVKIYKHMHDQSEPPHMHEFIEIAYVYSGYGSQIVNGRSYFVQRGDLIFMGMGDVHAFETEKEIGIINCLVAPEFLTEHYKGEFEPLDILSLTAYSEFGFIEDFSPVIKFSHGKYYDVEYLFDSMANEFTEKKTGYVTAINGYLQILLVKIFREIKKNDSMQIVEEVKKITSHILGFIEKNYCRKITLKELADESFYSPTYFSKIFKECFGKSLTQYVNELRVIEAKSLIVTTTISMDEIAHKIGFTDKKQFYKVFKDYYGTTPGEFRK